jgi:NADH:ubiquinone oxidoreductase subunit 3 (subunit A)
MELVLGFTLIILLSLLFAGVLLMLGRSVAPKARTSGIALDAYACGEPAFLGGKVQFNLELFNFALYFMLFEIIGFILFLSWGNPGLVTIAYLIVTLIAASYVSIVPQNE